MKKIVFVIISVLLILSLIVNFGLFYILRFNWDWDKERLQEKTRILYYLTNDELFALLNDKQLDNVNKSEPLLNKIDSLKTSTNDVLKEIQDELITFCGGLNYDGNYANPNAKTYVNKYFFQENSYRSNAYKDIDSLLNNYALAYEKLTGLESRLTAIPNILEYYKRDRISAIFYDMTLSEAEIALSLIKGKIELDFNEFLHK